MLIQESIELETAGDMWRRRLIAIGVVFFVALGLPASAAGIGFFKAKRIHKQADEALAAGDAQKASELFGQLAEELDRSHDRRADALYGVAVASLALPSSDSAAATEHLDELLEVFPRHERSAEARVLKALITAAGEPPEPEEPPAPAEPEPEPEVVVDPRVGKLQARVGRLEGELQEARDELKKKEEAIDKLKKLVVGEGG